MAVHDIPLERRTLHGHFSRDLGADPDGRPGDIVRFATLDAGWGLEPAPDRKPTERRSSRASLSGLDDGHPIIGPIEVRGATAGLDARRRASTRCVSAPTASRMRAAGNRRGTSGSASSRATSTSSGGSWTPTREPPRISTVARSSCAPSSGVLGMPPPEAGIHATFRLAAGAETSTARARRRNDALPADPG